MQIILFSFLSFVMIANYAAISIAFSVNQEVIIAKYCVNKDKPALKCEGKCYLRAKFQKQEKQESKNHSPLAGIQYFFNQWIPSNIQEIQFKLSQIDKEYCDFRLQFFPSDYLKQVFRPPSSTSLFV